MLKRNTKSFAIVLSISLTVLISLLVIGLTKPSQAIAYGCFHQVAHKGSGCAYIISKPNGEIILQLIDFQTAQNDDLHVLLISAEDALENQAVKNSERLYVSPLKKSEGFQEYIFPNSQNLTKFHAVTIWNNRHSVNFTTAPLRYF